MSSGPIVPVVTEWLSVLNDQPREIDGQLSMLDQQGEGT